jgi:dethiobiotin synthetase
MVPQTLVITGTDSGVGKTVLTALLARHLRDSGTLVRAAKPLCSGGREDAEALHSALDGALSLDQINPWYFRAPLAPLLAARRERRHVRQVEVLAHLREMRADCQVLLVEGAGGLLSPLGEDFDLRHLIIGLRAVPIVVAPNRLGVLNQVLLVRAALPEAARRRLQVVLMSERQPDFSSHSNPALLTELIDVEHVHHLPWLRKLSSPTDWRIDPTVRRALQRLFKCCVSCNRSPTACG